MKDNDVFVEIKGKRFLVQNIEISESGKVTYDISCLQAITDYDKLNIEKFVYTLLRMNDDGSS